MNGAVLLSDVVAQPLCGYAARMLRELISYETRSIDQLAEAVYADHPDCGPEQMRCAFYKLAWQVRRLLRPDWELASDWNGHYRLAYTGEEAMKNLVAWTPEQIDILEREWRAGSRSDDIAKLIGGYCTANSVIGKAHRLKIPRGVDPRPKAAPISEPEPIPLLKAEPPPKKTGPKPRLPTESWMCVQPSDEPNRFGLYICGRTVQPGRHKCAEHLTSCAPPNRRADHIAVGTGIRVASC